MYVCMYGNMRMGNEQKKKACAKQGIKFNCKRAIKYTESKVGKNSLPTTGKMCL